MVKGDGLLIRSVETKVANFSVRWNAPVFLVIVLRIWPYLLLVKWPLATEQMLLTTCHSVYLNAINSCAGVNTLTDFSFVSLYRLMAYLLFRPLYLKRVPEGLLEDFVGEASGLLPVQTLPRVTLVMEGKDESQKTLHLFAKPAIMKYDRLGD